MTLRFLSILFSSRTTGCAPYFLFPEQQLPKDSQVSTVPSLQVPRQALQRFPRARVEKLPTPIDAKRPSHPKVPNSGVSKVPNSYRFQVSNGKVAKAASAEVTTVPFGKVPNLAAARFQRFRTPHGPKVFHQEGSKRLRRFPIANSNGSHQRTSDPTPNSCKGSH